MAFEIVKTFVVRSSPEQVWSFLIDPEGKLMGSEMNFYNLGRNIEEQLRKFKANIYMAKKGGNEVCPSKWKDEGDKTLVNPGAKMVGRVHEALQGS